jgi:hypothetical protein
MEVQWKYNGSTMGVQWEYSGSTMGVDEVRSLAFSPLTFWHLTFKNIVVFIDFLQYGFTSNSLKARMVPDEQHQISFLLKEFQMFFTDRDFFKY